MAYSFSEAGQAKSVVVVEAHPAGSAQVKEILLSSGRPLVRWVAAGGLAQVRQWCDEGRDPRAWIDLEIHVAGSLSMDEIQDLRRNGGSGWRRPPVTLAPTTSVARRPRTLFR